MQEIEEDINVEQENIPNNTKYSKQSKQKYLPGMEDLGDEELENERKNLWKTFGRDTAAGKELFSLYKCYQPPKINYPKPKQKTKQQIMQEKIPKEKKECPQQTEIEYPPMSYKVEPQKYFPIDFVPKKKKEGEIKDEIENYYRIPIVPANKGVNRINLIEKLQIRMKNTRGGLPKGAELPMVNNAEEIDMTDDMKSQAVKRVNKKYKNFTNNPNMDDQSVTATTISQDPVVELNQLFDEIMAEIEERQKYLEEIKHLNEKDLNEKIKKEIIERVSELQKVTELRKFYKKKQ